MATPQLAASEHGPSDSQREGATWTPPRPGWPSPGFPSGPTRPPSPYTSTPSTTLLHFLFSDLRNQKPSLRSPGHDSRSFVTSPYPIAIFVEFGQNRSEFSPDLRNPQFLLGKLSGFFRSSATVASLELPQQVRRCGCKQSFRLSGVWR